MYPCPHCGEPLADNAVCCRECGSDLETGWNPDVDYYSVEIPDHLLPDESREEPGSISSAIYKALGVCCLILAFLGLGIFRSQPFLGIFGAVILLVMAVRLFSRSQPAWKRDLP